MREIYLEDLKSSITEKKQEIKTMSKDLNKLQRMFIDFENKKNEGKTLDLCSVAKLMPSIML